MLPLLAPTVIETLGDPDCSQLSEERSSPECEERMDVLVGGGAVVLLVVGLAVALWLWRVRRRLLERDLTGGDG